MIPSPFFIVGCGRSGTSLLRSLLNRHPRVAIPLESLFIVDYLRVASDFPLEQLKAMLVQEPEVREWGLKVSLSDLEDCPTIIECITRLHELYASQFGADVWGQKTPRLVRYLDLLESRFPTARIIHLIRDPRAVVNSLIRSDVHRSDAYHASLRWMNDVQHGLDSEVRCQEMILRLRYADLVTQPDQALSQVLAFIGLPEDRIPKDEQAGEGQEEYSEFYTNIHANLDRHPTPAFVDKWRKELSSEDQEVVEAICGPLMIELGFEPELTSPRLRPFNVCLMKTRRVFLAVLQTLRYMRFRRAYLSYLLWRKWKLGLLWEFLWTVNY